MHLIDQLRSLRVRGVARLILPAALVAVVACGDDGGVQPDTIVVPATILSGVNDDGSESVTVPATARVGVPFTVEVRSTGGGCTERDSTGVQVAGLVADVRPFVREPAPGRAPVCPGILKIFSHTAAVTIAQPGTATVRVHGRRDGDGATVTITRSVTVQP